MHHGSHVYILGALCLACGWQANQPHVSVLAQKGESSPQIKSQTQYELRVIRAGDTVQGIRFKPTTGKASYVAGDRWVPIPETGDVPAGDFDVILAPLERNFRAFRFDRLTGVTWQLTDRKWVKVREPE
jgi:hypothetical protein